jgi:acyl phosphate:glycerol-3-phosphate acyltransferase
MLIDISLIILAYLLGSISSAVVVCKMMQLEDPRTQGSNNPGATNVLRLYGGKAAIPTLAGDVLKGVIPVVIGKLLNAPDMILAGIGLAAFTGHLFPIFFNFKGGKGVATLVGVLFGTSWILGLAFMGTWLIIAAIFRYSSLAGLTAATTAPIYTAFVLDSPWFIASNLLMAILLFWRHTSNIKNLISGKEDKIGAK